VKDPSGVEYPAKDPTSGQVAARLDREVPRLESATASARTLAVVGIVVGVAGLLVGGVLGGLGLRRKRA